MKPCRKYKRAIAWLAVPGCQSPADNGQLELEEHMEQCPGCLDYHRQIREVCEEHSAAAESLPTIELSPYVLTRVRRKLNAQPQRHFTSWRLAIVTASAAVVGATFILVWSNSQRPRSPHTMAGIASPSLRTIAGDTPPATKQMTYHSAATRSLDELDEILFRQAQAGSKFLPGYRAGQLHWESE